MKKLLVITILMFVATLVAPAQTTRTPSASGKDGKDNYATVATPSFHKLLPEFELRQLGDLRDDSGDVLAADLLDYARSFMGLRYRRGGKTPKGFDCSGFTGYVFNQFGYRLGASSRDQWRDGKAVADEEILPGDLLFFNGRAAGGSRVGHVGIAISADPESGEITFIHSSCTSGISIDKTTDPYYARRYLGARRVIERQ